MKKNMKNLGIMAVLLISGALAFAAINMNNQIGDEVDNTNHIYSSLSQDFDGDKCGDGKCGTDKKAKTTKVTKETKKDAKVESKCGDGKCGADKTTKITKTAKKEEGKCGEGKSTKEKTAKTKKASKKKENKCGAGKCGVE